MAILRRSSYPTTPLAAPPSSSSTEEEEKNTTEEEEVEGVAEEQASLEGKLSELCVKNLFDIYAKLNIPRKAKLKRDLITRIIGLLNDPSLDKRDVKSVIDEVYNSKRPMKGHSTSKQKPPPRQQNRPPQPQVQDIPPPLQQIQALRVKKRLPAAHQCPQVIEIAQSPPPQQCQRRPAEMQKRPKQSQAQGPPKVECICGKSDSKLKMLTCSCGVMQHSACVGPKQPETSYCHRCQVSRAEPFLEDKKTLVAPTQLSNTFRAYITLTHADRSVISKQGYEVQAWCMKVRDSFPGRFHWPRQCELRIGKDLVFEVAKTPLRREWECDEAPLITHKLPKNVASTEVSVSFQSDDKYVFGLRIVRKKTDAEVIAMAKEETPAESKQRVVRCLGGNGDADVVVADSCLLSLRCPLTGTRPTTPGRFKECTHMGCFDLPALVEMGKNMKTKRWRCPICMKICCIEDALIDGFITDVLHGTASHVTDVSVTPDGSWMLPVAANKEPAEVNRKRQRKQNMAIVVQEIIDSDDETTNTRGKDVVTTFTPKRRRKGGEAYYQNRPLIVIDDDD